MYDAGGGEREKERERVGLKADTNTGGEAKYFS